MGQPLAAKSLGQTLGHQLGRVDVVGDHHHRLAGHLDADDLAAEAGITAIDGGAGAIAIDAIGLIVDHGVETGSFRPATGTAGVITSYSIHYTKLYDEAQVQEVETVQAMAQGEVVLDIRSPDEHDERPFSVEGHSYNFV